MDLFKTIVKVTHQRQWMKMSWKCNILHLAGRFQGLYWIQIFGLQFYGVSKDNGKAKSTNTDKETRVGKDRRKNWTAGTSITGNNKNENCGFRTAGLGLLSKRRGSLQPWATIKKTVSQQRWVGELFWLYWISPLCYNPIGNNHLQLEKEFRYKSGIASLHVITCRLVNLIRYEHSKPKHYGKGTIFRSVNASIHSSSLHRTVWCFV